MALTLFALLLAACGTTRVPAAESMPTEIPDYQLRLVRLQDPAFTEDGYDIRLNFELTSEEVFPFRFLIQEIEQQTHVTLASGNVVTSTISLVEAFRLSTEVEEQSDGSFVYRLEPQQRDRHFESGFLESANSLEDVHVIRTIRLYPGEVRDADFTSLGFAHLPTNRLRSVVTEVPPEFNRRYQEHHQTRGAVVADDRERAMLYTIAYRWKRLSDGEISAVGDLLANDEHVIHFGESAEPIGLREAESAGR